MIDFTSEFGQTVKRHLEEDYFIWLTTIDSNLTPQPRPVWFIWDNDSVLIFSEPKTHKVQHIKKHKKVALHFNTVDTKGEQDVIVFAGEAILDSNIPSADEVSTYLKKYETGLTDLEMTPDEFCKKYLTAIRVTPSSVRGW